MFFFEMGRLPPKYFPWNLHVFSEIVLRFQVIRFGLVLHVDK